MTAPVFMCTECAKLNAADRPKDPTPPHDPLSTDAVALVNDKPVCAFHRDQRANTLLKGVVSGGRSGR
jgi:hypothetical protein